MKIRLLVTCALALMLFSNSAKASTKFGTPDFSFAEIKRTARENIVVRATLSETGAAKMIEFNQHSVGEQIDFDIGGIQTHFVLREPIISSVLEMGPFSKAAASAVADAINHQ